MFIIQLRNGNFALMQSHSQGKSTLVVECESYDAAMEIKKGLEE